MPLPKQTTLQVDNNDCPLYTEEYNSSIGDSLCIVILIGIIKVSTNCSIKI